MDSRESRQRNAFGNELAKRTDGIQNLKPPKSSQQNKANRAAQTQVKEGKWS